MDENSRKRISNIIRISSMVIVVGVMIVLIWAAYTARIDEMFYKVALCVMLFAFWIANDVVEPIVTKAFDDRTPEQIRAYRIFALLNLVGYTGLAFFAMSVGGSNGIYGALVFAVTMMYKKRFLNKYLGIEEEDEEEQAPEEITAEQETDKEAEQEPGKEEKEAEQEPGKEEKEAEQEPGKEKEEAEQEPGKEKKEAEQEPGKEKEVAEQVPGKEEE